MKLAKPTKQLIVTSIFLAFLFVMMAGLVLPVILRRLGVMENERSYMADEPDEIREAVNIRERYPVEESIKEEQKATLYDRVKKTEAGLRSMIGTIETFSNENVPARTDFIEWYIKIQKALGSRVIDGEDVVIRMNNGSLTFLSEELTEEEAKSIALIHAGFTADQVTQLRVGFEYDDGIPEYTVEFREGYLEYEYEIHAVTGQILSFEKDD